MTARVVSIDGPNYSGKTTLVGEIVRLATRAGLYASSATGISKSIIGQLILERIDELRRFPAVLEPLVIADKWLYWHEVVENCEPDVHLIIDRYAASFIAYQCIWGRTVEELISLCVAIPKPEMAYLICPPADILQARRDLRSPTGHIELTIPPSVEAEAFKTANIIMRGVSMPLIELDWRLEPRELAMIVINDILG